MFNQFTLIRQIFLLLVFISFLLVLLSGLPAHAVAPVKLFMIPESAEITVGETMRSEVRIDTGGVDINAVDLKINFNPSLIEVLSVERANSIIDLWVEEPHFSSSDGTITFIGGKSGGYKGSGVIGQVYWKPAAIGEASLQFDAGAIVLLNDGFGTKAELELRLANYIVKAGDNLPRLSSSTHPDENNWYTTRTARLTWEITPEVSYSYVVAFSSTEMPDEIPDEPVGKIKLNDLADGVYYFRLRQRGADGLWSGAISRQIKIDATAPDNFEARISRDERLFENRYFLSFNATDAASGLAYYEIKEGDSPPEIVAQAPYVLKQQKRNAQITVRAFDKAGNDRSVVIEALPLSVRLWEFVKVNFYLVVGLIFVIVIAIFLMRYIARR